MPEIERGMVLAGRYQIEEVLGKGGSGLVLRAFDRTAQMVVAVKILKQDLVHDPRWSKRFARELRLGRPIRHPNVCRIFDIGEGDGYRFLTMELATGGTLRDLVKKGGPLRPLDARLADARAAISGLAAIHEAGIVHRDVKPDNMLRMEDGRLALSDFGLATDLPTAAAVTIMVGTPHYMAPEIRAGEPATMRSDVWSLGIALYEIFYGRRPEKRSSSSTEGWSKPPAPLTSTPVERAMLALCEKCLADSPTERPADATVVAGLFVSALSSPRRFLRGRRMRFAVIAVALLSAAGFLAARLVRNHDAPRGQTDSGLRRVVPTGNPLDWSRQDVVLATLPGPVHCLSASGPNAARIVWGSPRLADDVDLATGRRRSSPLAPETFRLGCPEVSATGRVLFSTHSAGGVSEIRFSEMADGSSARAVTPGVDPLWLNAGSEFLYSIDTGHVAMFSLSTMSFTLLPDPGLGGKQLVSTKAVSPDGQRIAVLYVIDGADRALSIYERSGWKLQSTSILAAGHEIQFADRDRLLIAFNQSSALSTIVALTLDSLVARHVGKHPGLDLIGVKPTASGMLLVGRRRSKDVWVIDTEGKRRITADGENYSAAMSNKRDLLLGRRSAEGRLNIWWRPNEGPLKEMTSGPADVRPDISADGSLWTYVDYHRRSIVVCRGLESASCRVLREDDALPTWPRLSPSGEEIAYVTQRNAQRLAIVSIRTGEVRDVGAAFAQCPPIWSGESRVWGFEGSAMQYAWVERDSKTGTATGRRFDMAPATNDANEAPDETQCWPRTETAESSFLPRLRIEAEETSHLLRLDEPL
jgi:hypothetical protein